ncbi:hypothetical protein SK128_001445 [Halocaridina rubra]|uniref:Uncharacterized protein n=1 Tax=Halocaridina rubra TaxID=373956 RepID=A0AAN8X3X7_HALRR
MEYVASKHWQWVTSDGSIRTEIFEKAVPSSSIKGLPSRDVLRAFHVTRHFPRDFGKRLHWVKLEFKTKADSIHYLSDPLFLKRGVYFEDMNLRIGYVQVINLNSLSLICMKSKDLMTKNTSMKDIIGNKRRASKRWCFYTEPDYDGDVGNCGRIISSTFGEEIGKNFVTCHFPKTVLPQYLESSCGAISEYLCFREFDVLQKVRAQRIAKKYNKADSKNGTATTVMRINVLCTNGTAGFYASTISNVVNKCSDRVRLMEMTTNENAGTANIMVLLWFVQPLHHNSYDMVVLEEKIGSACIIENLADNYFKKKKFGNLYCKIRCDNKNEASEIFQKFKKCYFDDQTLSTVFVPVSDTSVLGKLAVSAFFCDKYEYKQVVKASKIKGRRWTYYDENMDVKRVNFEKRVSAQYVAKHENAKHIRFCFTDIRQRCEKKSCFFKIVFREPISANHIDQYYCYYASSEFGASKTSAITFGENRRILLLRTKIKMFKNEVREKIINDEAVADMLAISKKSIGLGSRLTKTMPKDAQKLALKEQVMATLTWEFVDRALEHEKQTQKYILRLKTTSRRLFSFVAVYSFLYDFLTSRNGENTNEWCSFSASNNLLKGVAGVITTLEKRVVFFKKVLGKMASVSIRDRFYLIDSAILESRQTERADPDKKIWKRLYAENIAPQKVVDEYNKVFSLLPNEAIVNYNYRTGLVNLSPLMSNSQAIPDYEKLSDFEFYEKYIRSDIFLAKSNKLSALFSENFEILPDTVIKVPRRLERYFNVEMNYALKNNIGFPSNYIRAMVYA